MISKSESNKIYYQKNKDRLAEKWKNDESRKAYLREYYKKNKKIILERAREWNKRNKEARKLIKERAKRRVLKPFWVVESNK